MSSITTQKIEKEQIPSLDFHTSTSVSPEKQAENKRKLERGMTLGNLYHNKIKIIFEDTTGIKEVNTTVWAVGDKNIVLKQGMTIPLSNILDVKI